MLRQPIKFLALASGLLATLSGCMNSSPCSEGSSSRLFGGGGGLFNRSSSYTVAAPECDCHAPLAPSFDVGMVGPSVMMPAPMQTPMPMATPMPAQIPITNVPAAPQPPPVFRIPPQATPTPYVP